jgi:hypothetical protein
MVRDVLADVPKLATSPVGRMGPCGFHLFALLTKQLVGKEFAADGNVKQGVTPCLQANNTDHFYVRTQAVLPWRFKCLNVSRGSVEF